MANKLRPDLEVRLKNVLKHKIIRLREAFNPNDPDEEEDDDIAVDDPTAPTNMAPANAPKNAPVNAPTNMAPANAPVNTPMNAPAPANAPKNAPINAPAPEPVNGAPMPKNAPANGVPANAPKNLPISAPANSGGIPDDVTNPSAEAPDAVDGQQSKIRQAKVKLFFDKLQANPTVMNYLNFSNPLEQAEAIIQFAELVQVPRTQLLPLLQQIRTLAQTPANSKGAVGESVKKKSLKESDLDGQSVQKDYSKMSIGELAGEIRRDWKQVNYAAKPYLSAMFSLNSISDSYGADSGRSVVAYFLSNASQWRGPVAKLIKAELNKRLKSR